MNFKYDILYNYYLSETIDYKGEHEAPDKDNGMAMHNLEGIYPDDIYSSNGAKYYGDGRPTIDNESISIIRNAKDRPKAKVKIYRAVPDINKHIKDKIESLYNIISYYNTHNFFPSNNEIVDSYTNKYYDENEGYTIPYNDMQTQVISDMQNDIEQMKSELKDEIKINSGDWVTISKKYAVDHGRGALNNKYKILSKTVPANTLYNDGNSIHEWGYWI
jgi:hypothetical protein